MKPRLFSISPSNFGNFVMIGVGIGWDRTDTSAALMLIIGKTIILIGPHYPPRSK